MTGKLIWSIFWALVGVFIISVATMFIPFGSSPVRFSSFAAWPILTGLGVVLIVLTIKKKVGGMLKKFLLLTGASTVGLPVFAVLHNLVFALFIKLFGEGFWERTGLGDEPVFFIIATMVCPIGFIVGVVGSLVLAHKSKPPKYSGQNI